MEDFCAARQIRTHRERYHSRNVVTEAGGKSGHPIRLTGEAGGATGRKSGQQRDEGELAELLGDRVQRVIASATIAETRARKITASQSAMIHMGGPHCTVNLPRTRGGARSWVSMVPEISETPGWAV